LASFLYLGVYNVNGLYYDYNVNKKRRGYMVDIISLGAGVQSSTMLMMADRGLIKIDGETIIPKYAIMSDTGNEPKKVMEWLKYLQSQVKNIEIVVTKNGDIITDTLNGSKTMSVLHPYHFSQKERYPFTSKY
jgi:3'-phosphoadenosine 5'-phosphosulfate sulfotransferase (PAPS reductase)/FAD synthetase